MTEPRPYAALSLKAAADRIVREYGEALRALAEDRPLMRRMPTLAWFRDGEIGVCVSCRTEISVLSRTMRCPDCGATCSRPVMFP